MGQLTELHLPVWGMTHEDMEGLQNSQRLCASIRFLSLIAVGIRMCRSQPETEIRMIGSISKNSTYEQDGST
ncbi:unnamed protein product [Spirodela intermedia]|uniref:Uncharacterized protein n=1 Tax=Spirodela intermedia TaxID=51605 RepID=A0A7I8JQN8_SPIIN|nr:unnamed protein product [Spirodela intermedia]CAA6672487.1 unnamed protein product [Spirodela intermedia]